MRRHGVDAPAHPAPVTIACQGCGVAVEPCEPYPFRCPAWSEGGDLDHVLAPRLDHLQRTFPPGTPDNPFVHYRTLLSSWHRATAGGIGDAGYVEWVERLDRAVMDVCGAGFHATPFARNGPLSEALGFAASGGVWVKDETGNVSGSHKARHLMGIELHLKVSERLGLAPRERQPGLAIASCGNAALAAAVIARAAGRHLVAYVPPDAEPAVLAELERLGCKAHVTARVPGTPGDPCYSAFQSAVHAGSLPFCCQGNANGMTIEGGETLAWEVVSELAHGGPPMDRWVVQVGGGALASSCMQALGLARELGAIEQLPRMHTVQTRGAWPLRRAWERLAERVLGPGPEPEFPGADFEQDARTAERLAAPGGRGALDAALRHAATHRSNFMRPWETEPHSFAHGILDDETYDWLQVCQGMCRSGGWPLVVSEDALHRAHELAHSVTPIRVCPTGSAGLAGLQELRRAGIVGAQENVAVLFTGVSR